MFPYFPSISVKIHQKTWRRPRLRHRYSAQPTPGILEGEPRSMAGGPGWGYHTAGPKDRKAITSSTCTRFLAQIPYPLWNFDGISMDFFTDPLWNPEESPQQSGHAHVAGASASLLQAILILIRSPTPNIYWNLAAEVFGIRNLHASSQPNSSKIFPDISRPCPNLQKFGLVHQPLSWSPLSWAMKSCQIEQELSRHPRLEFRNVCVEWWNDGLFLVDTTVLH